MKDVIDGRRQQIAEAEAKKRAEKEEELAWRRANEEDMELARRQLDEKLRMATEASLRHRAELEAQISERKSRLGDGDVSSAFVDVDVERNERFARRFAEEKQTSKVYSF
jgi:DNA helicase TIP49 (TBP-interacting protein)